MQQQWPGHSPQVSAGDDRSVWGDGWCYVAREGLQVIEALKFKLKDLNTWRLGGEIKRMFAFQSEQHE